MRWAAHIIKSLTIKNCMLASMDQEFIRKAKFDPNYKVVVDIIFSLHSLSFYGFSFVPIKINMFG